MERMIKLPLYLQDNIQAFFILDNKMVEDLKFLKLQYSQLHDFNPKRDYRDNMIRIAISDIELESLYNTSLIDSIAAICCHKIKNKNQKTALNLLKILESGLLDKYPYLSHEYIISIWSKLTYQNRNIDAIREGYRKSPVNVYKVGKNIFKKTLIYSALSYKMVEPMMTQLIDFCNNVNIDSDNFKNGILKSIILSAYFVYIHPFLDGNGRTSRLLMNKLLIDNNLFKFRYLSVNTEITKHKPQYTEALRTIEANNTGDFTKYISYMLSMFRSLFEHVANPNRKQIDFNLLSKREKIMLNLLRGSSQGYSVKDYKLAWNAIAKTEKYSLINVNEAESDLTHLFNLGFISVDEKYTLYPGFKYYNK